MKTNQTTERETRKSFVFNVAWHDVLKPYPPEVRLEVYEAAIVYASTGEVPDLQPLTNMAFSFIKKEIDYNNSRWNETLEKRRAAGRAGAQARWQSKTKSPETKKEAFEAPETEEHIANDSKRIDAMPSLANMPVNVDVDVNVDVSKEKLSNESKKKSDASQSHAPTRYRNFMLWMKLNAPNVYSGCGRHFTEVEYGQIRRVVSREQLVDCVLALENRKDLLKKYRSLYLTLRNWIKRDEKRHEKAA